MIEKTPPSDPSNPIKSIQHVLDIIEALQEAESGSTVGELSKAVGLSKGTVSNYLSTLRSRGWVVKSNSNHFTLGLEFVDIADEVIHRRSIYESGHQEVDELAERFEGVFYLQALEQGLGYCLKATSSSPVLSEKDLSEGTRRYLHCNGGGLAILAHLDEDEQEEIINHYGLPECTFECNFDCPLARFTSETMIDYQSFDEHLEEVITNGYARTDHEQLSCIGIPVFARKNQVVGSVGALAPKRVILNENGAVEPAILEALKDAASRITISIH